jgi:hypothetical protein
LNNEKHKPKKNIDMEKKERRGGSRQGSGARKKYGERTRNLCVRVPESRYEDIKNVITELLKNCII